MRYCFFVCTASKGRRGKKKKTKKSKKKVTKPKPKPRPRPKCKSKSKKKGRKFSKKNFQRRTIFYKVDLETLMQTYLKILVQKQRKLKTKIVTIHFGKKLTT